MRQYRGTLPSLPRWAIAALSVIALFAGDRAGAPARTTRRLHRTIAGRVVDEQGEPIEGAMLWWHVTYSSEDDDKFLVHGTSDAQGNFQMRSPSEWLSNEINLQRDFIWVHAEGKGLKVVRAAGGLVAIEKPAPWEISLPAADAANIVIEDPAGNPLPNASIELWNFLAPNTAYDIVPLSIRAALRVVSDDRGRAVLPSHPSQGLDSVRIAAGKFGLQQIRFNPLLDGADFNIRLRATRSIEGRLIASDPKWVRGVRVHLETSASPLLTEKVKLKNGKVVQMAIWETEGVSTITTDDTGSFVVPAIAEGKPRIWVDVPKDSPVLPRIPTNLQQLPENGRFDVLLDQAVEVSGLVLTRDGDRPVKDAVVSVSQTFTSHFANHKTDENGRYFAKALPGEARLQLIYVPEPISPMHAYAGENVTAFDVPQGVPQAEAPTLFLSPTRPIEGKVVDAQGRPVPDASIHGTSGNRICGFGRTDSNGLFTMRVPEEIELSFVEVILIGPDNRASRKTFPFKAGISWN